MKLIRLIIIALIMNSMFLLLGYASLTLSMDEIQKVTGKIVNPTTGITNQTSDFKIGDTELTTQTNTTSQSPIEGTLNIIGFMKTIGSAINFLLITTPTSAMSGAFMNVLSSLIVILATGAINLGLIIKIWIVIAKSGGND